MNIPKDNFIMVVQQNGFSFLTDYKLSKEELEAIATYVDEFISRKKEKAERTITNGR